MKNKVNNPQFVNNIRFILLILVIVINCPNA